MYRLLIIIILVATIPLFRSEDKSILFFDSFESDNFKKNWFRIEECCPYSINTVDSVYEYGNKSLRFELNYCDTLIQRGKRAELLAKSEDISNIERWYRFSIYLPENFEADSLYDILTQWHGYPDFDKGETWRSPPIAFGTLNNQWMIDMFWAVNQVNTNKTVSGEKKIYLGKYERNAWTKWIFHMKYSYSTDGILQVWKNDKLILDYSGPNYYNDKKGPSFKIGIYKPAWKIKRNSLILTKRIVFVDNVGIGNSSANFKMMSSLR